MWSFQFICQNNYKNNEVKSLMSVTIPSGFLSVEKQSVYNFRATQDAAMARVQVDIVHL